MIATHQASSRNRSLDASVHDRPTLKIDGDSPLVIAERLRMLGRMQDERPTKRLPRIDPDESIEITVDDGVDRRRTRVRILALVLLFGSLVALIATIRARDPGLGKLRGRFTEVGRVLSAR